MPYVTGCSDCGFWRDWDGAIPLIDWMEREEMEKMVLILET
jgi:hypothetical protein